MDQENQPPYLEEQSGDSHQKHSSTIKNKRRTRKDEEGRDYYCQCGKSYLSYPALYTHIKTKHEGKISSYSVKNNNTSTTRTLTHKNTEDGTKQLFNKEDLEQLKMLLYKFYPSRQRATPIAQIMKNLNEGEKQYLEPLLNHWAQQNLKEGSKSDEEQKKGKEKMEKKVEITGHISADFVFGRFLHEMNTRVSLQCITFLARFIIMIRRALCTAKSNPKYCEQNTALMVPTIFNDLITQHLLSNDYYGQHPNIQIDDKDKKIEKEAVLQDEKSLCKVLNFFANWMYNNNYTNYTVRYRQESK